MCIKNEMQNMINFVSGLLKTANGKDKCLIWQFCIHVNMDLEFRIYFYFLHF